MEYKRYNDKIVLRLDVDDELVECVKRVALKENITAANVSGIGATAEFTVGIFNLKSSEYDKYSYSGNHEITSLTGNITEVDGKPYVHLHITAAGDGNFVGGHLLSAKISLTAEIIIDVISADITRVHDEKLKINTLFFK